MTVFWNKPWKLMRCVGYNIIKFLSNSLLFWVSLIVLQIYHLWQEAYISSFLSSWSRILSPPWLTALLEKFFILFHSCVLFHYICNAFLLWVRSTSLPPDYGFGPHNFLWPIKCDEKDSGQFWDSTLRWFVYLPRVFVLKYSPEEHVQTDLLVPRGR